ncbi:alanine racemase [Metabacillus rhizolycopersici]|uniref:Alanine racemase n=1 Tax=Metabacillus rhizolycopersici TaxID=2875709 RepID=A0ABS7UX53_9BACI|nr:alanine racemase [Metabacillus rhizolycopersici]MBZ5752881.1 alanine racemase [Metabacillus rhizolycopersici]
MQEDFYRDTWVEVNLDAITHNVRSMKHHIGEAIDIIAVVKANAYGHGALQVAKTALDAGASLLAVAFLDEALMLRNSGIDVPILVLGATRAVDVELAIKNDITLTVFSLDWLNEAKKYMNTGVINLHVKLDTGMSRLGVRAEKELSAIVKFVEDSSHFAITGIYTHFATADESDIAYFNHQYKRFQELLNCISQQDLLVHCGNSATGLRFPDKLYNAVRLGISMYGLSPSVEVKNELPFPLEEVFSLQTKLVHVKKVPKGTKVSYGATYETTEDEWIGTLPIGYADGWLRSLKDSDVLVEGKRVPLIGRVCMDQCMVKLPYELPVGTKVTLIGKQNNEHITVDEVAKRLDTINYEVPCMITSRVPRMFLKNKSIIEVCNPLLNS